ncbi:hypothetical protein B0A50_02573 [Salinomyces thailandicus]|uniref:SHSP domain-containing protein n=1 Tax=Salinomyces thailandicus TaxID=706561 RepID=A0A4U0U7D4_9PEZI|nr:hypothetical protein B0A50_02573 [Salinomyces thailandica]
MSLFPRFVENEFAPMFRLLDSYANHAVNTGRGKGPFGQGFSSSLRSFTPRFDVREAEQTYELHGELPGIEQKNINIEFTDRQTLTIKGHTEHTREEGQRPTGFIHGGSRGQIEGSDGYKQPSVEDESAIGTQTGTTENPQTGTDANFAEEKKDEGRYWLSERSVGEFARTFSFPNPVDQEKVKASLKDGVLSVVVPKAPAPQTRRIDIE